MFLKCRTFVLHGGHYTATILEVNDILLFFLQIYPHQQILTNFNNASFVRFFTRNKKVANHSDFKQA